MKQLWFSWLILFALLASACTTQMQSNLLPKLKNLVPTTITDASELPDTSSMTIEEIVKSVGNFSRLAEAVESASMDLALQADGPLTVFVPDNAAFEAIPDDTLASLLADPALLATILQYHLVVDRMDSVALAQLDSVETAAGEPINVTIGMDGELLVNGAQIVYRDLPAANGVIHVINQILTPPSLGLALPAAAVEAIALRDEPVDETLEALKAADTSGETVIDVIQSNSGFKTAATAIAAAGLTDALRERGPFTLFVPTDAAFREIADTDLQALLNDKTALTDRLRYHLVLGDINSADLATMPTLLTASGEELVVTVQEDGRIFVNGTPIYQADIEASNGVIHVIGGILTPPSDDPANKAAG
jgi:uncharacterized surface protein with fasciclin (FAS1) repeats